MIAEANMFVIIFIQLATRPKTEREKFPVYQTLPVAVVAVVPYCRSKPPPPIRSAYGGSSCSGPDAWISITEQPLTMLSVRPFRIDYDLLRWKVVETSSRRRAEVVLSAELLLIARPKRENPL